jgi:hypothetical protein
MYMYFEHYRFILTEDLQLNLFKKAKPRSDVILALFSTDFKFQSKRGTQYEYKNRAMNENFILGEFFERKTVSLRESPDSLQKEPKQNWKNSYVVINLGKTKDKDSQLFFLQKNFKGSYQDRMRFLKETLTNQLNGYLISNEELFRCEFHPVLDSCNFWDLKDSWESVREIEIEYTMPNFLGITNKMQESLKKIKDNTNATKFKQTIINENGNLNLSEAYEDLRVAVDNSKTGQSRLIVRDYSRTSTFDSEQNEKVMETKCGELIIETEGNIDYKAVLNSLSTNLNTKEVTTDVTAVQEIDLIDQEQNNGDQQIRLDGRN